MPMPMKLTDAAASRISAAAQFASGNERLKNAATTANSSAVRRRP